MQHNHYVTGLTFGLLLTLGVMLASAGLSRGAMQNRPTVTITVDCGGVCARPLAETVTALEKRYGWVITYEEPPYVHPSEISDVTHLVSKAYDPANPYDPTKARVLIPKGGTFEFEFFAPLSHDANPQELTLQSLLAQYRESGLPEGGFRVLRTGSVFHIVPGKVTNHRGVVVPHRSPLDTIISVPAGTRTAEGMIAEIVERVAKSTGTKVLEGVYGNLLRQTRIEGGVSDEPARQALLRTLHAANRKFSWRLLYDPGSQVYVLSIHEVKDPPGEPR
jgi:hypothetical protein